jgi:hypothetical protein
MKLHKTRIPLSFIVNPFYLYCISFSLAITVYVWGWSSIFPKLSVGLILFFIVSFILFIVAGYIFSKKNSILFISYRFNLYLNDLIFGVIILLGLVNILYMGYLPVLDRSYNYREFGMPVIDPVFNTLSIFFSVFFFQTYLRHRKKRFLIYFLIILIVQILLFRRSTIMWIFASSSFLYLLFKQRISILVIIAGIICIPFLSYCFGLYGNTRSNLTKSFVLNDLGASNTFKDMGINYNHYMTYLYISSPLANLQENIDRGKGFLNREDVKDFIFYSLMPVSVTIRLEKPLNITPPACNLINPELIVGSLFMISYFTLGWLGMIIMLIFLFVFIVLCLFLIKIWNTFFATTLSILSTTISLLIFSNFLNRLDVILMLFIYPVFFHFVYTMNNRGLMSKELDEK